MLAGVILFSSWIVQNYYQSKWSTEKEALKRSQLVIDIEEVQRTNLEIAYHKEFSKLPLDTAHLAFVELRLTEIFMNLISWSQARLDDNEENVARMFGIKHLVNDTDRLAFNQKNYSLINANFKEVTKSFGNNFRALDDRFSQKYYEVENKSQQADNIFAGLYLAGTILLGIAYIDKVLKGKE